MVADEYARYVGQSFYAFSYGADRYVAVDTSSYERIHDRDLAGAHADQWSFLQGELETSRRAHGLTVLFSHYDHTSVLGGRYPISHQLENLVRTAGVGLYLHGHLHTSYERPGDPVILATGTTLKGEYRVVEVNDSTIVRYPLLERGAFKVEHVGPNDGTTSAGEATVENRSAHDFARLEVTFLLSASTGGYRVTGGRAAAIVIADDGTRARVVVELDLKAGERRALSAWKRPGNPSVGSWGRDAPGRRLADREGRAVDAGAAASLDADGRRVRSWPGGPSRPSNRLRPRSRSSPARC